MPEQRKERKKNGYQLYWLTEEEMQIVEGNGDLIYNKKRTICPNS